MKLLRNIITIFFLFFYSSLQAEIIKEIVIKGNKRVSEETIKIYGGIEINKDYSDKDLTDIIKEAEKMNCKIITTEKDFYRLNNKYIDKIKFVKSEIKIQNENEFLNIILN